MTRSFRFACQGFALSLVLLGFSATDASAQTDYWTKVKTKRISETAPASLKEAAKSRQPAATKKAAASSGLAKPVEARLAKANGSRQSGGGTTLAMQSNGGRTPVGDRPGRTLRKTPRRESGGFGAPPKAVEEDDSETLDAEDLVLEDEDEAEEAEASPTPKATQPAPGAGTARQDGPGRATTRRDGGANGANAGGANVLAAQAQDGDDDDDTGNAGTDDAGTAGAVGNGDVNRGVGSQEQILPGSPDLRGNRVDILDGEIPVSEFLRFLAGYSQLPVLVDSSGQGNNGLNQNITIAAPIINVDDEMVKAILQANRWLIAEKVLGNGTRYLDVQFLGATPSPGSTEPSPNPLVVVDGDGARLESKALKSVGENIELSPDEITTMLFKLKYREPQDAIDALNSLISQGGGGTSSRTASARNRAFSAVEIKDTMMLIVTAKFGMLDYIFKLLEIIDVEFEQPERIVRVIEVEEADAQELTSIVENFLDQRRQVGRSRSRTGTSRPRTTPTTAGSRSPTTSRTSSSSLGGADEFETTLIPDARTQKIIVQTYSQSDLEDINMLIRELDTRFDIRRLRTRIYRMKFLKAVDVAPVIQDVLGIGGGSRRSGTQGLGSTRNRGTSRGGGAGGNTPSVGNRPLTGGAGGQGSLTPSLIVAHEETNSLIVQSEPEDYQEVLNILSEIDVKRRQVFLEAALVQVSTTSALNYTIELLAGEPDDNSTRALFESSFGLTGIDSQNFTRIFPDLTTAPSGALLAIMTRGKFPALISALKANTDTEVLATPFILADDNVENEINITETRYVLNTNTVNQATTTNQQGEDAGITLNIIPTISSSEAVLLDVQLEVSEFAASATVDVLPPKTTQRITSAVTIAGDRIYVVGGLTRQSRSKSVSKVPLLGDIPLLGKLFRSESSSKSTTNLYIFLRAHILTDDNFEDLRELSKRAEGIIRQNHPDVQLESFQNFQASPEKRQRVDPDAPREVRGYRPKRTGGVRHPYEESYEDDEGRPEGVRGGVDAQGGVDVQGSGGIGEPRIDGSERSESPPPSRPGDSAPPAIKDVWDRRDLEADPDTDTWFPAVRKRETASRDRKRNKNRAG